MPNLTAVAPVKPVPPIVTSAPTGPEAGENPLMEGGGITVKLSELVAVPPGAATDTGAVIAPAGTVAVIWVFETTVNAAAFVVPNLTAVAPVKPEPLIVTEVPTGPEFGENPLIVGTGGGGAPPQSRVPVWSTLPLVLLYAPERLVGGPPLAAPLSVRWTAPGVLPTDHSTRGSPVNAELTL